LKKITLYCLHSNFRSKLLPKFIHDWCLFWANSN